MPVLVFDGDLLPMKKNEESTRHAAVPRRRKRRCGGARRRSRGLHAPTKAADATGMAAPHGRSRQRARVWSWRRTRPTRSLRSWPTKELDVVLTEDLICRAWRRPCAVQRIDTHFKREINRRTKATSWI